MKPLLIVFSQHFGSIFEAKIEHNSLMPNHKQPNLLGYANGKYLVSCLVEFCKLYTHGRWSILIFDAKIHPIKIIDLLYTEYARLAMSTEQPHAGQQSRSGLLQCTQLASSGSIAN